MTRLNFKSLFLSLVSLLFLVACSQADSETGDDSATMDPAGSIDNFSQPPVDASGSPSVQNDPLPLTERTPFQTENDPLQVALGLEEGVLPPASNHNYTDIERCTALISDAALYDKCLEIAELSLNSKKLDEQVLNTKKKEECDQFPEGSRFYENCIYLNAVSDVKGDEEGLES